MSILLKSVRVSGFRGLENIQVELEQTTILTGMNNTGKTSFLKALQLALGYRQFITQDDFFIKGNSASNRIVVDLLIVPITTDGKKGDEFSEDWESLLTTDRIRNDDIGNSIVPLRTIITFDTIKNSYKSEQFILQVWPEFIQDDVNWFDNENGKKKSFHFDEIPFFYMDAQRDILEDTKLRNSYLGKMLSKIEYSEEDIKEIEKQIKTLNEQAVSSSDILSKIKTTLKELDTAMDTNSEGIEITPFTKKIRDLNKGLTIYYSDQQESFSMDYHGMGTRSWSSLLTLKSFISLLASNAEEDKSAFFPILAIEEPEAHLHPNAQKKLYTQMDAINGQKIISTHSPYIAAMAKLNQIRNFYKNETVSCGKLDLENLTKEEIRKIVRQVINSRGEIFFSKVIIFFEGETEEQALPILAQKFFDNTSVELGLDFVGVGGYGNYLPFLRFTEALNIPWFIFSDAENQPKASVQKQFLDCGTDKNEEDCIVFLNDGNDFERQLIEDGFGDEIKQAIIKEGDYQNEQHKQAKVLEIGNYDNDKLYEVITGNKTQYGPAIAEQITEVEKDLPAKVIDLFEKITTLLKVEEI
ncbi:MAG: AAA family ATPase [Deltaproteobacteria bacterium]|mgnify:CR=1 FL=1|jgi:putative ATP-dependent endonuclease of the OLD family|nr:AAA family ATPase [Deltaproteobacteria bacterium]